MKGGYGMLNKIRVRHGMKKTQDLKKKKKNETHFIRFI